jgi:hypothetical protein
MGLADRQHFMDEDVEMMDPNDTEALYTVPPGEEGTHVGGTEVYEDIIDEVYLK